MSSRPRRPRWVYDAGSDPDPRFSLANERTALAWVRTALAMLAGGVALHALGLPSSNWLGDLVAISLVAFGGLVTVGAMVRWARVERAMRQRTALPAFTLGFVLTGAVVVGAALIALALA